MSNDETKLAALRDKIQLALADPQAPWYGSDLVPLVGDYLDARSLGDRLLEVLLTEGEIGLTQTGKHGHSAWFDPEYGNRLGGSDSFWNPMPTRATGPTPRAALESLLDELEKRK